MPISVPGPDGQSATTTTRVRASRHHEPPGVLRAEGRLSPSGGEHSAHEAGFRALHEAPLVDEHRPDAREVRAVLDNPDTHTPAALYESFEPAGARRIVSKLQFHYYTPEHASWLAQVEV